MDRGLIIRKNWLDKIFETGKTMEMRSTKTNIRGRIGLIEAKSGLIVGEVTLYDCTEKLTNEQALKYSSQHQVDDLNLLKKWCYGWKLKDIKKYPFPVPYLHPKGAVIWVNIAEWIHSESWDL